MFFIPEVKKKLPKISNQQKLRSINFFKDRYRWLFFAKKIRINIKIRTQKYERVILDFLNYHPMLY